MIDAPIKAITLWQPWASAIDLGIKVVETRSWRTHYRGRLAIHAAADDPLRKHGVDGRDAALLAQVVHGLHRRQPDMKLGSVRVPRGTIVATVRLVDCVRTLADPLSGEPSLVWTDQGEGWWPFGWMPGTPLGAARTYCVNERQRACGDFRPGRWAWLLADVETVDPPIPAKGRQTMWTFDAETAP